MVFPIGGEGGGGNERKRRVFPSLGEEGGGSVRSVFPWGNGGICLNPIPIPLLCNVHPYLMGKSVQGECYHVNGKYPAEVRRFGKRK
jgi:hypothetical protein